MDPSASSSTSPSEEGSVSSSSAPSTPLSSMAPSLVSSSSDLSNLALSALSLSSIKADQKEEEVNYALPPSMSGYAVKTAPPLPSEFPPLPPVTALEGPLDKGTPDEWVKRDERMIRLTGKHPCNVEAPVTALFNAGFLTPSELFYVRSHGSTPRVDGELLKNWRINISGLVKTSLSLSLADLKSKFEVVTLPVTLVCAGNRRKEQNVVRKGLGFNWGSSGLSTALFTGVYLCDILKHAGLAVSPSGKRPRHVIFEGADDLPQGRYGTSQTIARSMDRSKGMMICWLMNGLPLEPDHGFPVRLVVPGQIGGRSVKWLNKIEVSTEESHHYLHYWDNKLLPTQVMPEEARAEKKWWYDPKYIINDLNVNSAICQPDHNDILKLESAPEIYPVKGYAYAGGGRRITRIEVSMDEGNTWTLSEITYPEDLYREIAHTDDVYGNLDLTMRDECFCWCFWSFDVPVTSMKNAGAIMVRAMDESLALQPRDMYWNATSMMNNWWFRVAIHHDKETNSLRFEHPTLAGTAPGGWMERMKEEGADILRPSFKAVDPSTTTAVASPKPQKNEVKMTRNDVQRLITLDELKAHNTPNEPWFVVQGEVYDGTGFLKDHPGGGESITLMAGEDATEDFMAIHSPQGKLMLADYHIGTLVKPKEETTVESEAPKTPDATFLQKNKWKKTKLTSITSVSPDSKIFRFTLERGDQPLGLPVGHHVYVRARRKGSDGEMVQRAYTPISKQTDLGFIDLLIKLYMPNTDFPAGGRMSACFAELEVGDEIELKGPLGSFEWLGKGVANWRGVKRKTRNIGMICGGSGVTPILQILRGVFEDPDDVETRVWILNGNRNETDILCREDLDLYLGPYKDRYRLHHTLTIAPPDWPVQYSKGRLNIDMLRTHLPPPGEDSLALFCGPDAMLDRTVKPGLKELGWNLENSLVIF